MMGDVAAAREDPKMIAVKFQPEERDVYDRFIAKVKEADCTISGLLRVLVYEYLDAENFGVDFVDAVTRRAQAERLQQRIDHAVTVLTCDAADTNPAHVKKAKKKRKGK